MIGVICTGGTIGSSVSGEYISPDESKPYKLIEMYRSKYGDAAEFITDEPYRVLSENMTCDVYPKLVNAVKKMLSKGVDGVIVTHGSDTLQYSAAVLACTIGTDSIPVVLVSSNYVLEDKRANGLDNFAAAVDFISNKAGLGVFVSYRNSDGIVRMYYGNALLPHDIYHDDVRGVDGAYYGYYENGKFIPSGINNPCKQDKIYEIGDNCDWDSKVLVITAYPGMKYPSPEGYKAILHLSYHCGTICAVTPGLKEFAKKAREMNIPFYLAGVTEDMDYESCKIYDELGIISLPHVSPITAYVELWLRYSSDSKTV